MNMMEEIVHPMSVQRTEPGRDRDPLQDPVQDPLRDPKWKEDDKERDLPGQEEESHPIEEEREIHPEFDEDNREYPLEEPIETPKPPM